MAEQPGSPTDSPKSGGRSVLFGALAVAIIVALVVASVGLGLLPSSGPTSHSTSPTSSTGLTSSRSLTSPTSSTSLTGSTGSTGSTSSVTTTSAFSRSTLALCSGLTPAQELSNTKVASGSDVPSPNYDEQLLLGFEQNFTSSISYNVTLRAQNDTFGFGPVYLLNGLTDSGYWYQVGVAWNLGLASGTQYAPGFRFVYEVWNTTTGASVFPRTGGTLPTRFSAGDGDVVLLSLNMTRDGQLSMVAHDWNTSAQSSATYAGFGASQFLGFKDTVSRFPTSLLTEWYHVLPFFCSEVGVVYSNDVVGLSSAWMRIDELNLTGVLSSQRFNSSATGHCCVFATGYQGVGFQDPAAFQSLTTNGTTIFANSHRFVTP